MIEKVIMKQVLSATATVVYFCSKVYEIIYYQAVPKPVGWYWNL